MSTPRYRVVQWATGNIGRRALREVIRHPAMDLGGVLVFDDAKGGVDAGVLCGEAPVGVAATTDRARIRALEADCVLYMPRVLDLDDVLAMLDSGTNVVTTCSEFFAGGRRLGDERRARVLDACARTGASVYATGSSPGFITDALPFALLSLQRRVELFPIPPEDLGSFTPAYTANRPVNAIPYVCRAPAGILSTLDLPHITPAGPSRND